jgi:hypothetical protein
MELIFLQQELGEIEIFVQQQKKQQQLELISSSSRRKTHTHTTKCEL